MKLLQLRDTADEIGLRQARIAELEASIQKLESRLSVYERVFFENPVPAIVYNPESFAILEANDSALSLYGYKREQFRRLEPDRPFRSGGIPQPF